MENRESHRNAMQAAANPRVTWQNPEATFPALEKVGADLVPWARSGKMDPVIGGDDEMRRVIGFFSRETRNNPGPVGEPGVGKTARKTKKA